MNLPEYQNSARRTQAPNDGFQAKVYASDSITSLLHAQLGLSSEVGEFADALKKYLAYGRELDRVNLAEEIGDVMWYLALASDALGVDLDAITTANIAKLKARYPEKFSDNGAVNRDIEAEHTLIEMELRG